MKEVTIIYPNGKPHKVIVTNCGIYELNGVTFPILEYIDEGLECITPVQLIDGQMYKVPFHDIDYTSIVRIGEIPIHEVPSVISTVIFRDEYTKTEEIEVLQEIANATYSEPEWLAATAQEQATATATQVKYPPERPTRQAIPKTPKYEHVLYTTYYYNPHVPQENRNAVIYQHQFGLYTFSNHSEFFEKPATFGEIKDAINDYVYLHGQNIEPYEELAPIVVSYEARPGTTIADHIMTPDGQLRQVLLLAVPGIHEYTVHFGKTPYKELHRSATNPQNIQLQIVEDGVMTSKPLELFREGFNLENQIIIGNDAYEYGEMPDFDSRLNNPNGYYRR